MTLKRREIIRIIRIEEGANSMDSQVMERVKNCAHIIRLGQSSIYGDWCLCGGVVGGSICWDLIGTILG